MRSSTRSFLSLSAVVLAGLLACQGTGPQFAQVQLYLKDAPSDQIASAQVWISRAYLVGGGESDTDAAKPGFTISDTPQQYDLLQWCSRVSSTSTLPEPPSSWISPWARTSYSRVRA